MKMRKSLIAAAVGCFAFAGLALAQSYPPPQVQSIGSSDLFQDVVQGVGQAESYYATSAQMGAYGSTLNGGNWDNALIGGDFAQNLFQRGTSVSTAGTTYYVAYGADRWFTWGGTSTPTTMTQQTGAGDFPVKTSASYRINKASLTGTAQICTSQIVESSYGYRMQGQTVEFTFDAKAGAGFSAASSNLAVYVSTGTVADEGSTYMAYGLNAHGGAGTTAWTGQKNLGGTGGFLIPISTNWTRYGVAVPIASTANEVGVSICYTPVGTGGATDWFEFAKAQLDINPALTPVVGSAGIILAQNDPRQKSYSHRPTGVEAQLQYRYYYEVKESGNLWSNPGHGRGVRHDHDLQPYVPASGGDACGSDLRYSACRVERHHVQGHSDHDHASCSGFDVRFPTGRSFDHDRRGSQFQDYGRDAIHDVHAGSRRWRWRIRLLRRGITENSHEKTARSSVRGIPRCRRRCCHRADLSARPSTSDVPNGFAPRYQSRSFFKL